MSIQTRVYHLLSGIVLLTLLLTPLQSLAQPVLTPVGDVGQVGNLSPAAPPTGLFRTHVTVRTPADRARLEKLDVVVILEQGDRGAGEQGSPSAQTAAAGGPSSVVVLADEDQLEALARLRFEPEMTDDLGALVTGHAAEKSWLAQSLQPLLSQAAAMAAERRTADVQETADQSAAPSASSRESAVMEARASLRAAVHALTPEQQAGIAALSSIDDAADGLTNTEEAWWCTDPLNPSRLVA